MKLEFQSFPTKYLTSYSTLLQKLLFFIFAMNFSTFLYNLWILILMFRTVLRICSALLLSPLVLQPK